ncbi:HupE/UreJ family protein [Saprospiraceae bacterium]|nr:HupE/UreJ family protein [Saprospiraceae bacterium]MDA9299449.1 HupE/UreJ family protein [Saprospiraceae bacterium]MDA9358280.1 HupE/UreJ family protein [Saprospiraceae bacterium]MDA9866331.1 HupE/UreJ family protein [Saprospiraceae bacterium]MDB4162993.1 HupE/UreJ family protein [Saprospiraceae bacterium]
MISIWLQLGFEHILDLNGYDHILYLITLCAIYSIRDWKKVLYLATAFTMGHSITLALNAFDIVSIPSFLIETLIPVTIILTALYNLVTDSKTKTKTNETVGYFLGITFGLIHGMGISNFLKALMSPGDSLIMSLLGFNIGVELAQIVVVLISLAISYIALNILKVNKSNWIKTISLISILISLYILSK